MKGGNQHGPALRNSPVEFFLELRRRVDEIIADHPEDPDYVRKLNPKGEEYSHCLLTLAAWESATNSADTNAIKHDLVTVFLTCRDLSKSIIEVSDLCLLI